MEGTKKRIAQREDFTIAPSPKALTECGPLATPTWPWDNSGQSPLECGKGEVCKRRKVNSVLLITMEQR